MNPKPRLPLIKLSANENFYGCSPLVRKAVRGCLKNVHLYPEHDPVALKNRLGRKYKVPSGNILLGCGAVGIIDDIIKYLTEPDDEILTFEQSFVAYTERAKVHGIKYHLAPLTGFECNPAAILPMITPKTRIIFLANPNNPTGTIISQNNFEELLRNTPPEIYLVSDEAYKEYTTDPFFPDSIPMLKKHPNLIILRSFSKIYGIAGLRIGYGFAREEVVRELETRRLPFGINSVSVIAALAALADRKFIKSCVQKNQAERQYLYEALRNLGYSVLPSQTNFIYLRFRNDEAKMNTYERLLKNGIQVCDLKVFGQDNSLRFGIADRKVNRRVVECLEIIP